MGELNGSWSDYTEVAEDCLASGGMLLRLRDRGDDLTRPAAATASRTGLQLRQPAQRGVCGCRIGERLASRFHGSAGRQTRRQVGGDGEGRQVPAARDDDEMGRGVRSVAKMRCTSLEISVCGPCAHWCDCIQRLTMLPLRNNTLLPLLSLAFPRA